VWLWWLVFAYSYASQQETLQLLLLQQQLLVADAAGAADVATESLAVLHVVILVPVSGHCGVLHLMVFAHGW